MLKFIVMSDLHLVPEGELSHTIDTFARLERAVIYINTFHKDAEFCVLLGDLADHGDPRAYLRLKEALKQLTIPTYYTLGNHDDADAFREVFGSEKAVFDRCIELKDHRVIVLNSQKPSSVEGELDANQMDWLKDQLVGAKGKPVIVALHHPIADQGTGTDFILLKNPESLLDLLKEHGDVRHVISGHVHTTTTGVIDGIPVSTVGGNHYNFSPFSNENISEMTRVDGPGELAVVLSDERKTIVHFDKFYDSNQPMPKELFVWNGD